MVQVLERQPDKWERLASGLTGAVGGVGDAAGAWKNAMNMRDERQALAKEFGEIFGKVRDPRTRELLLQGQMAKQKAQAELAQKQAAIQKMVSSDWFQNEDPAIQEIILAEANDVYSAQTGRGLINYRREKKAYEGLNGGDFQGNFSAEPSKPDVGMDNAGASPASPVGGPQKTQPKMNPDKRNFEAERQHWNNRLKSPNKAERDHASEMLKQVNQAEQSYQQAKKFNLQESQFEYQKAKPALEYASNLAKSLPNQEQFLIGMETALANRNLGFFTRDNLAEKTGLEFFRSPEGALAKASIKEYFLGDVKGVGGRGLNQWLEKQLNDAMLKIGRSNAANEIVLAGFEAKFEREKAWLEEFERIREMQEQKDGSVRGNIDDIVNKAVKPQYEKIQKNWEEKINKIIQDSKEDPNEIVLMTDPQGRALQVPRKEVEKLLNLGAKLKDE